MVRTPGIESNGTLTARHLLAVEPEDTVGEAAEKMLARDVRAALVVEFGRLIGALAWGDVVRAVADRAHPSEARVREWMTAASESSREGDAFAPFAESGTPMCHLHYAAGRVEPCPGASCPFWRTGGCALLGLLPDVTADPELARFFLGLRERLTAEELTSWLGSLPGFAS